MGGGFFDFTPPSLKIMKDEEMYGHLQPFIFMIEVLRQQGLGVEEIIKKLKQSFDGLEHIKHKTC